MKDESLHEGMVHNAKAFTADTDCFIVFDDFNFFNGDGTFSRARVSAFETISRNTALADPSNTSSS
jgi:hypothetical protein